MAQIHSKLSPPRATAPTIPYDISSLDPLPIDIQNVIYDKLLADPDLIFTLASLSKSHYTTLIPRLYERVEVTDRVVARGLFEGLLTGANHLEAPREGCLPTKRDLLENCRSLVVASLPAFDATTDAINAWEELVAERRETCTLCDEYDGIFHGVTHLAWGPDLINAMCLDEIEMEHEMDENGVHLGERHYRRCLSFRHVNNVCLRLPYPLPKATRDRMMPVIPNYVQFWDAVANNFIRYHNCKSDPHMRSLAYPIRGSKACVDLMPAEFAEGVQPPMIRDIISYCAEDMEYWTNFESDDHELHEAWGRNPMDIIFTNIGTTISPDGTLAPLPPDLKQTVFEKLQRHVRHEVRAKLMVSAPRQVWAADRIHLRGYEECEFCPEVSH
ncbi:hypothetical protein B9479_003126 [Cryptococcus floricola]|uniref:Uncharacterized protein n=1 Tax=Cryptococcus floricola TaxID=2591691 RepID=A0A5D3B1F1_9TREE|nr:hypothetical protein B9479_003126 [Cryptococcus floricola]